MESLAIEEEAAANNARIYQKIKQISQIKDAKILPIIQQILMLLVCEKEWIRELFLSLPFFLDTGFSLLLLYS